MVRRVLILFLLVPVLVFAQVPQKANSPSSKLDPPLTEEQIAAAMVRVKHQKYLHRVADSFDQFIGSLLGRQDDQTISSAVEIAAHKNAWYDKPAVLVNSGLDLLQRSHGQLAQSGDLERCAELVATDATALTTETGVQVVPIVGGAELRTRGRELKITIEENQWKTPEK
jgi:hypothetical protein